MSREQALEAAKEIGRQAWAHKKKVLGVSIALGLMWFKGMTPQAAVAKTLEILMALAGSG